jgi:hypothetical protein
LGDEILLINSETEMKVPLMRVLPADPEESFALSIPLSAIPKTSPR